MVLGNNRIGEEVTRTSLIGSSPPPITNVILTHVLGGKHYELSNHLGSVLSVVSDNKQAVQSTIHPGEVAQYAALQFAVNDYYPFGSSMESRSFNSKDDRYGYQGSEKDDEFKGSEDSYTTEFRQLDPRLGRWLTLDPVIQPWQSPYVSMDDNPIKSCDILGNIVDGDPQGKKDYAKVKAITNSNISNYTKAIDQIKQKIAEKGPTKRLERQLARATAKLNAWKNVGDELQALENSSTVYYINSKVPLSSHYQAGLGTVTENGETDYDFTNERIQIGYRQIKDLGHELKHAYQYETGKIAFGYTSGIQKNPAMDHINNELEAYDREALFETGEIVHTSPSDSRLGASEYHNISTSTVQPTMETDAGLSIKHVMYLFGYYDAYPARGGAYRYKGWEADYKSGSQQAQSDKIRRR